eukprot:4323199-Pleurochrysis_carterae.AAC.2
MHSLPFILGVDAVCDWSLSLEEAIIGALAQNLELPEGDDIASGMMSIRCRRLGTNLVWAASAVEPATTG